MATPQRNDKEYGRPVAGSKTETRGRFAGAHISQEVKQLCQIILQMGEEQPDGTSTVTFRRLFDRYTRISNKVVGMLLRARKQNLVHFEGEMLFQRRDDDVIITLLHICLKNWKMTQKNIGTSVPDNEIILLEDLWHLNNVSTQ